nr:uncharacterized protein LOC108015925 [Drosophila suzukii]XP_036672046.1 uncharacterized protein LOC108015925 [Drosophila suzukii]
MAPDAEKPQPETRICALGSHRLRSPFRTISNETLRNFARLLNNDINSESLICKNCYSTLFKLYMRKVSNAKKHRLEKMADTVSDVSSQQADSSSDPSSIMPEPLGKTLLPFNLSSVMETSARTSAVWAGGIHHIPASHPMTCPLPVLRRPRRDNARKRAMIWRHLRKGHVLAWPITTHPRTTTRPIRISA